MGNPPLTTTPVGNAVTKGNGSLSSNSTENPSSRFGDVIGALRPLVEMNVETIASAFAKGTDESADRFWCITNYGFGGMAYALLKKGTRPFANSIEAIAVQKRIAPGYRTGTFRTPCVLCVHGESDADSSTYQAAVAEWQADYEAEIKAVTGQPGRVPMLVSQHSSWTTVTNLNKATALAPYGVLAASVADPEGVLMVGPKYFLTHADDGVHLINTQYRILGEYYRKTWDRYVENGHWSPLRPIGVERVGAVITVSFARVGVLVLDPGAVSDPGQYGFEWHQVGGDAVEIGAVELINGDTQVRITLTGNPGTLSAEEVRYAFTGTPGNKAGPVSGARGCLRDSDDAVGEFSGVTLHNWCVHFREPVVSPSGGLGLITVVNTGAGESEVLGPAGLVNGRVSFADAEGGHALLFDGVRWVYAIPLEGLEFYSSDAASHPWEAAWPELTVTAGGEFPAPLAYVAASGNDGVAQLNNPDRAYATVNAASAALLARYADTPTTLSFGSNLTGGADNAAFSALCAAGLTILGNGFSMVGNLLFSAGIDLTLNAAHFSAIGRSGLTSVTQEDLGQIVLQDGSSIGQLYFGGVNGVDGATGAPGNEVVGARGTDGENSNTPTEGQPGSDAEANGSNGGDGATGGAGGILRVLGDTGTSIEGAIFFGGDGGKGGDGGVGGNAIGGDGGTGGSWVPEGIDPETESGNGGNGGSGGIARSIGGNGGRRGDGGRGGTLYISSAISLGFVYSPGGQPGPFLAMGGAPGNVQGGAGGSGGSGGGWGLSGTAGFTGGTEQVDGNQGSTEASGGSEGEVILL